MDNDILLMLATLINYKKGLMNMIVMNNISYEADEEEDLDIRIRLLHQLKPPRITNFIVDVVNHYDEIQFQQNFRMKRSTFEYLLQIVKPIIVNTNLAGGRPQIDAKHQLLAVIWLLATPDSYRSVGERFNMSKATLSKCFVRILNALNTVIGNYIKWPTGSEIQTVKDKFKSNSVFDNLIGVVDGTYVPLSVSKSDTIAYTNRKCFTSMTLQAICDADMRYLDVFSGWPSSVPDIRIFKNSHLYGAAQTDTSRFFPNGEYILGDKAYPLLEWCIPPYMDRGRLSNKQILFNKKHSSCRQVIERSFALLFGRFRRLRQLDLHRTDWAPSTITACCILHNICLSFEQDVVSQYIEEGLSISENTNIIDESQTRQTSTESSNAKRDTICNSL